MGLHHFIKISNFSDADISKVMSETGGFNTHREADFHTDLDDVKTIEGIDGGHMAQIRDNIANMLWKNQ
ncbi:hypothetical protein Bca4012_084075 [Brassica carinata]